MMPNFLAAALLFAGVVCENGVCRLVPDEEDAAAAVSAAASPAETPPAPERIAEGLMSEEEILAFLAGEDVPGPAAESSFALLLLLAVLGGLALNLTPCVLPMVPVNLLVIGASVKRACLYGLGQMTAFGALGLAAAAGGAAFGTIQSSPFFNGAVALGFFVFALSLLGVFTIDFSRFRRGLHGGVFFLGAVSATLAGACLAPVVASVLVLTARLTAEGRGYGVLLPFAVGLGLALPWPFLGAGLKILPRPGKWMRWVNRVFALALLALAVHYALIAAGGFKGAGAEPEDYTAAELAESGILVRPREKPLVVFCHAEWCRNCPEMARRLSAPGRVREALSKCDVIRLDVKRPSELALLPGLDRLRGLPALAFYPAGGSPR